MPELFTIIPFYRGDMPAPIASVSTTYPVDVDTVGADQAQARLTQQITAGVYLVTFSISVNSMSQTGNAIYIRVTEDASIATPVWQESSYDVPNADDPLFETQQSPFSTPVPVTVDFAMQMRKETSTGVLDLDRMTITIQRVGDI